MLANLSQMSVISVTGTALTLDAGVDGFVSVGGGIGSRLESDEAIRAAAYSKREEDRRNRFAGDRPTD